MCGYGDKGKNTSARFFAEGLLEDESIGRIELKDGYVVEISSGSAVFSPFVGLDSRNSDPHRNEKRKKQNIRWTKEENMAETTKQEPVQASLETYVKIFNTPKYSHDVRLSAKVDRNRDWDGVSRPDHNLNNREIANCSDITEREEINAMTSSHWYTLTVTYLDQENEEIDRFDLRVNQHWALEPNFSQTVYVSGKEDYLMEATLIGKKKDDRGQGTVRIMLKGIHKSV